MKWITREYVKVDRVACPWLIKKFVDKDAEFIFVPADAPRTFTLRPVEIGRQAGDRTIIKAGLKAGDPVVVSGAFFLKSELILKSEADEE